MTEQQIQALIAANVPDNVIRAITPAKLREVLSALNQAANAQIGGGLAYNAENGRYFFNPQGDFELDITTGDRPLFLRNETGVSLFIDTAIAALGFTGPAYTSRVQTTNHAAQLALLDLGDAGFKVGVEATAANAGAGVVITDTLRSAGAAYAAEYAVPATNPRRWLPHWGRVSDSLDTKPTLGGDSRGAALRLGTNDAFALELETNNVLRASISATGQVGIGVVPGTARLAVQGDSAVSGLALEVTNSSGTQVFAVNNSGTVRVRNGIIATGNSGFGIESAGGFSVSANFAAPVYGAQAVAEFNSSTKGVLFPFVTTTARNAISSPPAGLFIFNPTVGKFQFWNGTDWETITSTV